MIVGPKAEEEKKDPDISASPLGLDIIGESPLGNDIVFSEDERNDIDPEQRFQVMNLNMRKTLSNIGN